LKQNDYIQWAIEHALSKPVVNPSELDPRVIASRFNVLAFAAIQSSVITLTNALFDIAGSADCASILSTMREEVLRETARPPPPPSYSPIPASAPIPTSGSESVGMGVSGSTPKPGTWTKTALSRLKHVDSALRESLRLNGFIERGISKMVVARHGVEIPDGSRIPCGVKVGVSAYSVHRDEANYADAGRFDAFRFVDNEKVKVKGEGERGAGPKGLVNTSETFLGFSHGSHAW
jgi:cytochrome P450